jgi:hypothetical protein
VLNSAVEEGTPFPKGPPKSSVGGTPGEDGTSRVLGFLRGWFTVEVKVA